MIKNRIGELLGIRYPLIQAPMNWSSGAELAAAVSNAGALGTLGPNAGAESITDDVELTGERLREQIRKVRELTGKPFAVNIPIGIGEGLKYSKKCVEVVLEEAVPVVITSVGGPDVYTTILQEEGIKVFHAISTARHARKAEESGVDAVVCEGFEAGGHKGFTELTTLVLTPLVADTVKIPVITGGGIGDARGILAALALGADAVYMGTRFMATKGIRKSPEGERCDRSRRGRMHGVGAERLHAGEGSEECVHGTLLGDAEIGRFRRRLEGVSGQALPVCCPTCGRCGQCRIALRPGGGVD